MSIHTDADIVKSEGGSLYSSSTQPGFSFNQTTDAGDKSQKGFNFDALEPGPNAKFIENSQKAYDNATTDKARENIAEASAKKEGLSRGKVQKLPQGMMDFGMSGSFGTKDQPGLFASPSNQRSLDFGTTGSFGTKNQPGFDFTEKPTDNQPLTVQPAPIRDGTAAEVLAQLDAQAAAMAPTDKLRKKADDLTKQAMKMLDGVPPGHPIANARKPSRTAGKHARRGCVVGFVFESRAGCKPSKIGNSGSGN